MFFHIQRKHFHVLISERGLRREGCPLFNAKYDVNDNGDLNIANNISKNPRTVLKLVQVGVMTLYGVGVGHGKDSGLMEPLAQTAPRSRQLVGNASHHRDQ